MADDAELTVGELFVLSKAAPGHPPGTAFDVGELTARDLRSPAWEGCAESLVAKGLLEREGGLYSLTGYGEACWRAVFRDTWRYAREGAGIGWKGKR